MWIDTHCHLDASEFAADRDLVAERALSSGVALIVVPTIGTNNFTDVADVCKRHSHCRPAWGIHPMFVDKATEADLDRLRQQILKDRPLAIGEIGLDGFVPGTDSARQDFFFTEQLKIAREFNLPVLLHIRRAQDRVLKQLRIAKVIGGIAHAFNGSRQQADAFLSLGFKLGFGGAMTHPRATRIRTLAAELPLDALVLETDAPDIPPHWLAGGRNEPGELPRIGATLAELRGLDVAKIAAVTSENAYKALAIHDAR